LSIGIKNWHTGNAEFAGEHASGGNTRPGTQSAVNNGRAISVVDLPVQGLRSPPVNRDDGQNRRSYSLHARRW
jgi:hypothetical protein